MNRLLSGWAVIRLVTVLVYVFLFGPVVVVILLSFNTEEMGGFPMPGVTLRWYRLLLDDQQVMDALRVSLGLGAATTVIATTIGLAAALALSRYRVPGQRLIGLMLTMPILVPHVVLGVAVLLLLRSVGLYSGFGVLLLGHVLITLPFVILVLQSRIQALPRIYEDAARSLGASPWHAFKDIMLPLITPAVIAAALFAFTLSFDDITATMFWKPRRIETLQTQILAMLQLSSTQEINALGTLLVLASIVLPLLALFAGRAFSRRAGA